MSPWHALWSSTSPWAQWPAYHHRHSPTTAKQTFQFCCTNACCSCCTTIACHDAKHLMQQHCLDLILLRRVGRLPNQVWSNPRIWMRHLSFICLIDVFWINHRQHACRHTKCILMVVADLLHKILFFTDNWQVGWKMGEKTKMNNHKNRDARF